MAGSWIKLMHETPDKPEICELAERLKIDQDAAFGKCVRVWIWADQQLKPEDEVAVTPTFIDRLTNCPGFAAALLKVGWLVSRNGKISIPNFDRHNGQSAKTRALTKDRLKRARNATNVSSSSSTSSSNSDSVEPAFGFEEFWRAWPRHKRKVDRARCMVIWQEKALAPLATQVIDGVERWKRSQAWADEAGEFVPMPATWLNARRWEDTDLVESKAIRREVAAQPKPIETPPTDEERAAIRAMLAERTKGMPV